MSEDLNYNKALGQIRSYIQSKKIQYGLSYLNMLDILATIISEQEEF